MLHIIKLPAKMMNFTKPKTSANIFMKTTPTQNANLMKLPTRIETESTQDAYDT